MVRFRYCYGQWQWCDEEKDPGTDLNRIRGYCSRELSHMMDDLREWEKPFHDDVSRTFLEIMSEHSDHTWSMDKNDRYSLLLDGERYCIMQHDFDVVYGLFVLRQSGRGMYTLFQDRGFLNIQNGFGIWDALAMMDMEVLIAVDPYQMHDVLWIPSRVCRKDGYVLDNYPVYYPYSHRGIELSREKLFPGKDWDGKEPLPDYDRIFDYDWRDHLEEIRKDIDRKYPDTKMLLDLPTEEISFEEYVGKLIACGCEKENVREYLKPDDPNRKNLRIINHIRYVPEDAISCWRRPPFVRMRKRQDGSIVLSEDLSWKWPDYVELLAQVIGMMEGFSDDPATEERTGRPPGNGETVQTVWELVVVTASDEKADFTNVVCGFLLKDSVIECFDAEQAARRFSGELGKIKDLPRLMPLPERSV